MRMILILIGFIWGVNSTKLLPEDLVVLKIKPEKHSQYFLLKENENLYYLIVNGNSQKIKFVLPKMLARSGLVEKKVS